MIIRTLADKTVVIIEIPISNEDEFIAKNPTGGFSKVASLPSAKYPYWKLDKNGNIIPDAEKILEKSKSVKIDEARNNLISLLQSLPVTDLKGNKFILSNNLQDQTNSLLTIVASQQVLRSPAYKLNTTYKLNDIVNLNDVILICSTAGKTDSSACTPPTNFGVAVTDGTAKWKLFGQLLATTKRQWYSKIKEQIKSCATQKDLDAITW